MKSIKNRRIINVGGSYLVTLPKEWIRWIEAKYGVKLQAVEVVADEDVTIRPKVNGKGGV